MNIVQDLVLAASVRTGRFKILLLAAGLALTVGIALAQPARVGAKPVTGANVGAGRTVVGKIALKAGSDTEYNLTNCTGTLKGADIGFEQAVTVAKDGTFRIQNVPAGKFDLAIDAGLPGQSQAAKGTSKLDPAAESAARVRTRFEVPVKAADQPLDIGTWEIAVPKLLTGKLEAPDFKCVTMDGEEFVLKDQRGKYVLLEFWASWCGFCRTETPFTKKIFQDFGKDPRFVMLSLSVDKEIDKAEKYVKQYALKWPQGVLGDWAHDKVSLSYGIDEVPTMLLIGPDGKIVAKSASGKAMHESVAKALAQKGGGAKQK